MKIVALCALTFVLISASFAKDKRKTENQDPIVWGMLSQNTGCVIFKEYQKTSGKFWGVAVTTSTHSELEAIETQNYDLKQKKWKETQENMDELQSLSLKDKIKFVKIPDKYSDQQLEKARNMCKEPSGG